MSQRSKAKWAPFNSVAPGSQMVEDVLKRKLKIAGLADFPPFSYYDKERGEYILRGAFLKPLKKAISDYSFTFESYDMNEEIYGNPKLFMIDVKSGKVNIFIGAMSDTKLFSGLELVYPATVSNPIHVIGQVGTNATASTTISGNSWHLLAPPAASTSDVDFNTAASDGSSWAGCDGDEITVDGANGLYKTYKCMNVGTKTEPSYKWTTSYFASSHTAVVPAGRGFWYKRNSDSSVTITWSGVPTTTASN